MYGNSILTYDAVSAWTSTSLPDSEEGSSAVFSKVKRGSAAVGSHTIETSLSICSDLNKTFLTVCVGIVIMYPEE